MLYLFCSAAAPLYKRDALECISYPVGHIFRFRYLLKYVQPDVLANSKRLVGTSALLVFLDRVGSPKVVDFDFYPLRLVTVVKMEVTAGAIYIDFRFEQFVNYVTGAERRDSWNRFFKGLISRPWPPGAKTGPNSDGSFVLSHEIDPPDLTTESAQPHDNWNSVVSQLDKTSDLGGSTFCLLLGFFQVNDDLSEVNLRPINQGLDSIYPVPMGKAVTLKMLLSRPSFDLNPKSVRTLHIATAGDAFAGMSKNKIISESRYNEDRTVLVCKRVFDTVLAIVSIEETNNEEARSPKLTLLTRVRVPRFITGTVVSGVAFSALLLGIDAEAVTFVGRLVPGYFENVQGWLLANAKAIAALLKLMAPAPIALAAYIAFRKLPIK